MKKFFLDMLTQNDNQTWCVARFGTFIGILTIVALGFIHAIYNHTVDFTAFGMGLGSILGGAGVFVGSQAATDKS